MKNFIDAPKLSGLEEPVVRNQRLQCTGVIGRPAILNSTFVKVLHTTKKLQTGACKSSRHCYQKVIKTEGIFSSSDLDIRKRSYVVNTMPRAPSRTSRLCLHSTFIPSNLEQTMPAHALCWLFPLYQCYKSRDMPRPIQRSRRMS